MTEQEIRDNAPRHANKYVSYKDGSIVYLKANDFFEYWYEGEWYQCDNSEYITFDLNMIGIFPL